MRATISEKLRTHLKSDILELDFVRILFRSKPLLSGPEELVAHVMMGRV